MKTNKSLKLEEVFQKNTLNEFPEIDSKFKTLEALWMDPKELAKFHDRLVGIVSENPNASEVIAWELEKTALSVEDLFARYNRKFRSVLDAGSMDESFIQAANDEEYLTNQRQKNLDISSNWDDNSNVVDFTAYNTTSFKDPLYWIENEEEDDETGDDQQDAA